MHRGVSPCSVSAKDRASVLKKRIRIKGSSPRDSGLRPRPPRPPVWSDNRPGLCTDAAVATEEAVNPHPSGRSLSGGISSHYGLNYFVKDEK